MSNRYPKDSFMSVDERMKSTSLRYELKPKASRNKNLITEEARSQVCYFSIFEKKKNFKIDI